MSDLSPALESALRTPGNVIFGAVELSLPGGAVRLLDGLGYVKWGARTFVGVDDIFGTLAAVDVATDGGGDEAPSLTMTITPASDAALSAFAGPLVQGSPVTLWLGVVDGATSQLVGEPYALGLYEIDVPTVTVGGKGGRSIELDLTSVFERFFENEEGARLSDAFHQSVWPGESGLSFVTGVQETVFWGMEAPRGAVAYSGGGGAGGGFGLNERSAL